MNYILFPLPVLSISHLAVCWFFVVSSSSVSFSDHVQSLATMVFLDGYSYVMGQSTLADKASSLWSSSLDLLVPLATRTNNYSLYRLNLLKYYGNASLYRHFNYGALFIISLF